MDLCTDGQIVQVPVLIWFVISNQISGPWKMVVLSDDDELLFMEYFDE
jgi:hypothetical protein